MVEIYKFTKERYSKGYFHTIKLIKGKGSYNFDYRFCFMFPYFGKSSDRLAITKVSDLIGVYYIQYYDTANHKYVHANFDTIYVFVTKTENVEELMAANSIIDTILNEENDTNS